jgi:hypothetical protein
MPLLRATFFFEDTNKHGWTETIHSTAADLSTLLAAATRLSQKRRDLLGLTAGLTFIRVSDDAVKRDSKINHIGFDDTKSRTSESSASDIANTCLVVRLDANPVVRRTLYMRGIPDAVCASAGRYIPTPEFRTKFDEWMALITTEGWACRTKDDLIPVYTISNVTFDPVTGLATITTTAPHLFTLTDPIEIKGVRGCTAVNGKWNIFALAGAETFKIKLGVLLPPYGGGGSVNKIGFKLVNITQGEVRRVSHRLAGRPFDSPRGRRKTSRKK